MASEPSSSLATARVRASEAVQAFQRAAAQVLEIEQTSIRISSTGAERAAGDQEIRAALDSFASGVEETGATTQILAKGAARVVRRAPHRGDHPCR